MTPPPASRVELPQPAVSPSAPMADAALLEDKMPDWLKMSARTAGATLLLGGLFCFFSFQRLWHTDFWGHLAYGRAIVTAKALPATEPLMPLALGVPFVDTAWMSQVIGFWAMNRLGISAVSFLYAAAITLISGMLLLRLFGRSRCAWLSVAGLLAWMAVSWAHLTIVRPQVAGLACFVGLLAMVTSRQARWWHWLAIPAMFAAWANLHGSFPVGLALLAGRALGRALDLVIRCGEFRAVWRDSQVRRFVLLTELAAAAALLNPYGLSVYAEIWTVAWNPNLADLVEWTPLQLRMPQGQATAILCAVLIVLYRLSPRRITSAEALLLFGFGGAAMWSSRMLVWFAPLATYYAVVHASAIRHARRSVASDSSPAPRNGRWGVVTIGLVWISFAITPFGGRLMHGERNLQVDRLVSRQTPLGISEHLKKLSEEKRLPRGQAFNTYEWGDFLLWAGPRSFKVFVASHAHLIPREVWADYVSVSNGAADWEDKLDRYGVNLLVLDESSHRGLIRKLREDEAWRQSYADHLGTVFLRKKPI